MNKEEKVKVVEELKGQLNDYKSIYLTDIAGLDAMQTSKLRRECFNSNVKLSVVKNTFLDGEEHPLTEDKSKTTPCLSQRIWNTLLLDEQKLTTPAT